jgi:hypothetical protein
VVTSKMSYEAELESLLSGEIRVKAQQMGKFT